MRTDHLARQKVLVLGGMGFIGSNLAAACLTAGADVTIFDSLEPRAGGNRENIASFASQVTVLAKDIRDCEALNQAVRGCDLIFNCAALTSHPDSMRNPRDNIDVNCHGVINLLEAVREKNRDAKIVQVGTSSQVGEMHSTPIDEWHAEYPLDMYSANKSAGEKYTLLYGRAYGLRTTVVRLANTFGPRASIRSPEFGFMNYFIGLALQDLPITVFGDGQQLRNISYVDDSVNALLTAGVHDEANGEVFFATAAEQISVRTAAELITTTIGGSVRFVPWPADRAAIEIGDAVISNHKMHSRLDWRPAHSLADGLARTRAYFAPRLEAYL